MPEDSIEHIDFEDLRQRAISQPLVSHIFTADPSAHVFDGKIYIYPSHDIDTGIPFDDLGSHFAMEDYHVLYMDTPDSPAVDMGVALHIKDVPWATSQMWAPDAAQKGDEFYLYFPAKRADGIFQIGVAVSNSPAGPFIAEPRAIKGSYTIDPAVFKDDDGKYYMYFGGLWGGQLQSYRNNIYDANHQEPPAHEPALCPKMALLSEDMTAFEETVKEILILDEDGKPLLAGDNDRRFFEASWLHKYQGKYYFSYSTGVICAITESLFSKSESTPLSSKQYTKCISYFAESATARHEATVSALVLSILPLPSWLSGAITGVRPLSSRLISGLAFTCFTSATNP